MKKYTVVGLMPENEKIAAESPEEDVEHAVDFGSAIDELHARL